MTRNMEISVPRHRHSPDAHDGRLCGDLGDEESGRGQDTPRGQYRGEGQIQRLDDGLRRDISAFSSLYQEEITMA